MFLLVAPEPSSIVKKLSFKKTHKRSTSHHITKANPDFVFDATKPAPEPPTNHLVCDITTDRKYHYGLWYYLPESYNKKSSKMAKKLKLEELLIENA